MNPVETASAPASTQAPCPLYKPLWELTEDDIAQVTREDCRRFLKEKGMRRPSWNKSQAIQQVISLKALLEPKPDTDQEDDEQQKLYGGEDEDDDGEEEGGGEGAPEERRASSSSSLLNPPAEPASAAGGPLLPPGPSPPLPPAYKDSLQFPPPYSTNYPEAPYRRRDPAAAPPLFVSVDASTSSSSFRIPVAAQREAFALRPEVAGVSPRVAAPSDPMTGETTQMTIFYGGRVDVYDAMPADKAVSIMQFASTRDREGNFPSSQHHQLQQQQQQIHQNQLFMHYNNSQQPFRLLQPPGTYASDAARSASFPRPHPVLQSVPFAAGVGKADANVKPHSQSQNRVLDNLDWINTNQDSDDQPDCPTSRSASLRRYLEKRKDRKILKCKKSVEGFSPSSMEMYVSQKFRILVPNGPYHVDLYSSTHPKPPSTPTRCSSMEKQSLNHHFSIDLNDDNVQEI